MNAWTNRYRGSPASLVMFAMMGLALVGSQIHEAEIASAAIKPVMVQIQSSMEELDDLHHVLLQAKQLTITGAALVAERREGNKP
ncbi:MAG: hypothetical protein IIA05_08665 [Proteobacteria bacterium]|nr:hypothetical protein [Pseudomonadota bacterium]MCH9027170.1 hypothetical protein [Pseudomonadota bacterium]